MSPASGYCLRLKAVGAPCMNVEVQFADQASKLFCAYRDRFNLGASDLEDGCGDVIDGRGEIVARISYNGRIWGSRGEPFNPG
jgi:hypothetical protein